MEDYVAPFTIGHHETKRASPVSPSLISEAHAVGYNLVTSPITTSHFHSRVLTALSSFLSQSSNHSGEEITSSHNASPVQIAPLGPQDTPLSPDESMNQILAYTSPWIDLCSSDPVISDISRQVLRLELQYAAFCGITHVMISGPRSKAARSRTESIAKFARAILESLSLGPYMQLLVWMPMINETDGQEEQMGDLAPFARAQYVEDLSEVNSKDLFGSWEAWDSIRSVCRYSTRLSVALLVPRLLPPETVQSRWYAEPVRLLSLEPATFTKNPKGYPVLTKAHQALVSRFAHLKQPPIWFLLCDVGPVPANNGDKSVDTSDPRAFPTPSESTTAPQLKDPVPHLSYLRNLQTKQPIRSAADRFAAGYQDYLQAPLQPLTVNLESITYEVFEKDPIKYEWYERAVARALHDWIEQGKPTSNPDGRVVVAVVGAGRGPLVTRALRASEAVGVEIDLWALEKNPNAFVLLQRHNQSIWNDCVTLVKSDMRTWRGPVRQTDGTQTRKSYNIDPDEADSPSSPHVSTKSQNAAISPAAPQSINYKIDILISELLGSFGDNELSPECLDGVQHLLNPVHGISIPTSYTAHITPISAPKLHADISLSMINTIAHAAETPYVVMFNAIDFLSIAETKHQSTKPAPTSPPKPAHIPNLQQQQHLKQQSQSYSSVAQQATDSSTAHYSNTTGQISSPEPIVHQTWAFNHPNPSLPSTLAAVAPSNAHNARYCDLSFPVPNRGTCHGIAGYFESVLYPGVELSTNPLTMVTKSEDMISWFPIFFPLKQPLYIPDNSTLTVQMWRQTDDRKVWYEWLVSVYTTISETRTDRKTGLAKTTQRKVRIGGSELHSSEKEACLM